MTVPGFPRLGVTTTPTTTTTTFTPTTGNTIGTRSMVFQTVANVLAKHTYNVRDMLHVAMWIIDGKYDDGKDHS